MLDAHVEDVPHVVPPRVDHDAAIAQRARPPLRAALIPPHHLAVRDVLSRLLDQRVLVQFAVREAMSLQRLSNLSVGEFGAPVRVFHDELARLVQNLMPHVEGRAHGQTCVSRRGVDVNVLKGGHIENLSVSHAVKGHPSRVGKRPLGHLAVQRVPQVEDHLLQPFLEGGRDVLVPRFYLRLSGARGPQPRFHVVGKETPQLGRSRLPGHGRAFRMVDEIAQVHLVPNAAVGLQHLAELVQVLGFAVRGQPHHLVLVAKLPEPQVLGERGVVHANGMGKGNTAQNAHLVALAHPPHATGKVAQPIQGKERGFLEGGHEEGTRQVGAVVLYAVNLRPNVLGIHLQRAGQVLLDTPKAPQRAHTVSSKARQPSRVQKFAHQAGARVARDRDVINLANGYARRVQTVANCLGGKTCGVLHPRETLLFHSSHQFAINDNRSRRVPMIRVDAQNNHVSSSLYHTKGSCITPLFYSTSERVHITPTAVTTWYDLPGKHPTPGAPRAGR